MNGKRAKGIRRMIKKVSGNRAPKEARKLYQRIKKIVSNTGAEKLSA